MSKVVYLFSPRADSMLVFGAGCTITTNGFAVVAQGHGAETLTLWAPVSVPTNPASGFFRDTTGKALAMWQKRIMTAPNGSLLIWDSEHCGISDELPGEDDVLGGVPPFDLSEPESEEDRLVLTHAGLTALGLIHTQSGIVEIPSSTVEISPEEVMARA